MCRGSPHRGIPSTTVIVSHVTQGRAEYKSTIPRGTDKGLDLWEAFNVYVHGNICELFIPSCEKDSSAVNEMTLNC